MNSKFEWQEQDRNSDLSPLPNLYLLKFAKIRFWDCGDSFLVGQAIIAASIFLFVLCDLTLVLVVFLVFLVLNGHIEEHI